MLPHESTEAYSLLRITLLDEHRPENETERLLVDRMAQHHAWLCSCATHQPRTRLPQVSRLQN